jgi:hypothetical protein
MTSAFAGSLADALITLLSGILEGEAPDTAAVAWALLELRHNPDLYKPANLADQVKAAAGVHVSSLGWAGMVCVMSWLGWHTSLSHATTALLQRLA